MRKVLLSVCSLVLSAHLLFAQSGPITGVVKDSNNEPIPGVAVKVKNTNIVAVTDDNGNFTINLPEGGSKVLQFQGIGLAETEYSVGNKTSGIEISMSTKVRELSGVNIYGRDLESDGSPVAEYKVTAEQMSKRPVTNIARVLDAAPGIVITGEGGQPGNTPEMHVRGFGSLSASSAPLIVIDGSIYNGSLSSLNTNDYESVSLLKDATASALYGSRGANGVILLTSKRGVKSDKPNINFDAQAGFVNRMLPEMETVDQAEYLELAYQAHKRQLVSGGSHSADNPLTDAQINQMFNSLLGGYNPYKANPKDIFDENGRVKEGLELRYTDNWMDEISRTGFRQQYNVSISNGDDKSDYYFSLGYNSDEGIIQYSSFDRITTKLNLNSRVTDWLRTGVNLTGNFQEQRNFTSQSNAYINPFLSAQTIGPIYPVYRYDNNGDPILDPTTGEHLFDFGDNPDEGQLRPFGANTNVLASLKYDDRHNNRYTLRGVTYLEATILKDFIARVDYSLDYINYTSSNYQNSKFGDGKPVAGRISKSLATQTSHIFRQMLSWKPSFGVFGLGEHSLSATVAHESSFDNIKNTNFSRTGFVNETFREGDAAAINERSGSSIDELAIESFLGVLDYNYQQKYFVNASLRRDGTSRFSEAARWGNFWSVGASWDIAKENYMKRPTDKWLDALRLKLSYGIMGNENLGADYYAWVPNYFYAANGTTPGLLFNSWGNPNLRWESQYMLNVGIEVAALSRFVAAIDLYDKGSNDLLYVRPYAPSTGIGGIRDNVGALSNKGIEVALTGYIVESDQSDGFRYNAQLNLSKNWNKVTKMQNTDPNDPNKGDTIIGGIDIMTKGLAVGTFFLPEYAGVDPANGDELWYLNDGTTTNDYATASLIENRKVMGSPFRDLEGAMINNFSYKNFDLSFQFNFGLGGKYYDNFYQSLMQPGNIQSGRTFHKDMMDAWAYNNREGSLPRVDNSNANIGSHSDRWLITASFLKLQNINFGYTVPSRHLNSLKLSSLRIYVAADNVWLLAGRKGVDIQQDFFGVSSMHYFPYRSVMFGINLGL